MQVYNRTKMASLMAHKCSITHQIMTDPVIGSDGYTYERSAIVQWLREHHTSPMTRAAMVVEDLRPNRSVADAIAELAGAKTEEVLPEKAPLTIKYSNQRVPQANICHVSVKVPDGYADPIHASFVVDTSGSMNTEVKPHGGEASGHNVLDVACHGINTSIAGMRDCDTVEIIAFSSTARVVFSRRKMDLGGKAAAKIALAGLSPSGSTNIWDGIYTACQNLPENGRIFLLTDGQPNITPPRGELHSLNTLLDEGRKFTLNTFGFGYNLNTQLLYNLARATQGSYSFIPDIGLVGTVFIHAMANALVTCRSQALLNVQTSGAVHGLCAEAIKTSWGYQIPIGPLCCGQNREFLFHSDTPIRVTMENSTVQEDSSLHITSDRQRVALGILECNRLAMASTEQARKHLHELVQTISDGAVKQDLLGQVTEAIEMDAYRKWGRHFLPSVSLAHETQTCNNFLDPGLQHYGGSNFKETRDRLADIFAALKAPEPSLRQQVVERYRSQGRVASAAPSSMRMYSNSSAPCFAGACRVHMADGTRLPCAEIRKGHSVQTRDGPKNISMVLKTYQPNYSTEFCRLGELFVTPNHPIRHLGKWTHPKTIAEPQIMPCEAVFSFLLDDRTKSMFIENIECITLAHGVQNDPVAEHSFFGTEQVVYAMCDINPNAANNGIVEIGGVKRDPETGWVIGLNPTT